MELPSLDDLAQWHETDKSSRTHGYAQLYEFCFASLREAPIALLEIGIGEGNSLRMWRDYFPQARIYGLDIIACPSLAGVDVTLFCGNQNDTAVLQGAVQVASGFDIIIDDGSHIWSDQITSFQQLFQYLRPGGYYAIEDLHTSYWNEYKGGNTRPIEFFLDLVHELNLHGRSGYGSICNDPQSALLLPRLSPIQRDVEMIVFAKSILLLKKKR